MLSDPVIDVEASDDSPGNAVSSPPLNPIHRFIASIPEKVPAFGILCALLGVTICVFQFIPYFIITIAKRYPFFGPPGSRLDLFLRCVSGTASLVTLYMAFRLMPLSDAMTLYMSSPVFVTIFAYFILKERITVVHVTTGTITIIGVFIICRPEFLFGHNKHHHKHHYEHRLIGIALSIGAAITSAYSLINLRKLKSTPVPVIVMWYSIAVVVIGNCVLPFLDRWVLPRDLYTWSLLVAIGAAGVVNQMFQTMAFQYESPGPISVTRSFNIVLAFIWEVAIFVEPIAWTSLLGAALITVSIVIIAINKTYKMGRRLVNLMLRKVLTKASKRYR
ncbi:unnamed protein product [Medioppia subpectinata]|uniref:EamA domain-containing protein n=1 Tax=Medioppia subpectinata TaxID=1979941 RepID=A0A7R9PX81_9ACAR|nr:unnamed protein product [Medioppia subpectinata]CAG2103696.1 unnamed protein product [Medioppia subpectinata]